MARRVDLFCEDAAHESWGRAVVRRVAFEEGVDLTIQVGTARLGIPRLIRELRAFARLLEVGSGLPDLLLILVDGNLAGAAQRRREIAEAIHLRSFPHA